MFTTINFFGCAPVFLDSLAHLKRKWIQQVISSTIWLEQSPKSSMFTSLYFKSFIFYDAMSVTHYNMCYCCHGSAHSTEEYLDPKNFWTYAFIPMKFL